MRDIIWRTGRARSKEKAITVENWVRFHICPQGTLNFNYHANQVFWGKGKVVICVGKQIFMKCWIIIVKQLEKCENKLRFIHCIHFNNKSTDFDFKLYTVMTAEMLPSICFISCNVVSSALYSACCCGHRYVYFIRNPIAKRLLMKQQFKS